MRACADQNLTFKKKKYVFFFENGFAEYYDMYILITYVRILKIRSHVCIVCIFM